MNGQRTAKRNQSIKRSLLLIFICAGFVSALIFSFLPTQKSNAGIDLPSDSSNITNMSGALKTAQDQVEKLNQSSNDELENLKNQGWQPVQLKPPRLALVNIDPKLLKEHEDELREQIQSNSFAGTQLNHLATIAVEAKNEATRFVAIDALGRSQETQAQALLVSVYKKSKNLEDQKQILENIRPSSIHDQRGEFLISLMEDQNTSKNMKEQASFPLIFASLLHGTQDELFNRVPATWQPHLQQLYKSVLNGHHGH